EWAADGSTAAGTYELMLREPAAPDSPLVLDWQPALEAALADLRAGETPAVISGAFHRGLAKAIAAVAARIGEPRIVLTGGCFQNLRLTEAALAALRAGGHEPIFHRRVPPNDGGIALGQAVWAAWSQHGVIAPCA
ncbi:MAG TPA: hypothetical protein VKU84_03220, partial [Stellaceae bacterium]|nr:hypothetical protein [Stellaceae bacterium]